MSSPAPKLRILISAYACEPGRGSEPGVGWNWAKEAAADHEVWVLTRANNRPAIERALAQSGLSSLHFIYCDFPAWALWWKRTTAGIQLYYVLWQLLAYFAARRVHRSVGFDVVHHLTFNSVDVPGLLWLLPAPFVWGPVGSGQVSPPAMQHYYGRHWLSERLRTKRKRTIRWNPLVRFAAARSSIVIAANIDTKELIAPLTKNPPLLELETAIPDSIVTDDDSSAPVVPTRPEVMTVLWSGNLIPRKAPVLALEVISRVQSHGIPVRLRVVGDGPLRSDVQQWIERLNIGGIVEILGRLTYSDMIEQYNHADVLIFTSLQDTSGNVVLEAMANGLPVVALDHQGVREMVDDRVGLKVPVNTREQVISDLAEALERLALDPGLRQAMGARARRHVLCRHTWSRKRSRIAAVYQQAASNRSVGD